MTRLLRSLLVLAVIVAPSCSFLLTTSRRSCTFSLLYASSPSSSGGRPPTYVDDDGKPMTGPIPSFVTSSSSSSTMKKKKDAFDEDDNAHSKETILVVGASGGTGLRALIGLTDVGYIPSQIRIMTRNETKSSILALQQLGFQTCTANLDVPSTLHTAINGCTLCYVHSTSSDTKQLDTAEVDRAQNLARAIISFNYNAARGGDETMEHSTIRRVVYNSAAASTEDKCIPYRIAQKHAVECVFSNKYIVGCGTVASLSFISLRANLFMEELWKSYTRPAILAGKYPFAIPSTRYVYLTSVRDMGRLAGTVLQQQQSTTNNGGVCNINVASDKLTPSMMAEKFAQAQNSRCVHKRSSFFSLLARLFFKDLYEVIQFYRTSTEITDIDALKNQFTGVQLTSFESFLKETQWGDKTLTYEDMSMPKSERLDTGY